MEFGMGGMVMKVYCGFIFGFDEDGGLDCVAIEYLCVCVKEMKYNELRKRS